LPFSSEKNNIFPVIYILLLVVLGVSSFFTDARLWGVNIWGYFPLYVSLILFVIGLFALIFVKFRDMERKSEPGSDGTDSNDRKYLIWVFPVSLLFVASFVLLKGQTFFLGDGYQVISLLAEDNYIKSRELGESLIHLWTVKAFGLTGNQGAQLSYQWLSIIAGVFYLVLTALFSHRLFDNVVDRILFFLGAISGGYMLLFFGYVENYTFFVLSVALYTMVGLLIVCGKMSRWWLVLFLSLPMFFHILGLILIPSAVYLLLVNTKTGKRLSEINPWLKRFTAFSVVIIIVAVLVYFYRNDYFFRFAIVPFAADRFTIENYTMFSLKHVLDFFNLLMLMLPAFPLMVVLLISLSGRKVFRRKEYRYLTILLLSALGAVFIFDPKLGPFFICRSSAGYWLFLAFN